MTTPKTGGGSPAWIGPQILAVLLIAGLAGAMAIGPTRQLMEQRRRIAETAGALDELQSSNKRLDRRIERLRDPDFLEQRAREEMGLIRPGETAYIVMAPKQSRRPPARRAHPPKVAAKVPEEPPGVIAEWLRFIGLN